MLALVLLIGGGCRGYVDPATLLPEQEQPNTPNNPNDDPEKPQEPEVVVPVGELLLQVDKTTLVADGSDVVTFKVLFGTESGNKDVSNAKTMTLIRTSEGTEQEMSAGSNAFSTTKAGTYTFKARYYHNGDKFSNTLTVVATPAASTGVSYYHKLFGMQFTSVGCQNCPELSNVLSQIREEEPGRLAVASYHMDFDVADPMTHPITQTYLNHFAASGLPQFFMNLRKETQSPAFKAPILNNMAKELEQNPPVCGVAIESTLNGDKLTVKGKFTSTISSVYRYDVILVEDNIEEFQMGVNGTYYHNNVVRHVNSGNIFGARLNSGKALEAGQEYEQERTITIESNWKAENMRIIVLANITTDGGTTWATTNCNECKVGASADYLYDGSAPSTGNLTLTADLTEITADGKSTATFTVKQDGAAVNGAEITCTTTGEKLSGNTFTTTMAGSYDFIATYAGAVSNTVTITATKSENPTPGTEVNYVRHHAIMDLTGAWCSQCPSGLQTLKTLIRQMSGEETMHILGLHDNTSGADAMALPLTNTIFSDFGLQGYPSYVINLEEAGTLTNEWADLRAYLFAAMGEPAECGVALESSYDASSRTAEVEIKVTSNLSKTYRVALYLLEDGIEHPQKNGSAMINDYIHDHVVRMLISSTYKGDRLGDATAGQELTKSYTATLDEGLVAENCSLCVMIIDGTTGFAVNSATCELIDGAFGYDISEE